MTELAGFYLVGSSQPSRVITLPSPCRYSLMDYCWTLSHHERPCFVQVITRINEMLKAHQV